MSTSDGSVFKRTGADTISARAFWAVLALFVCYGVGIAAWGTRVAMSMDYHPTGTGLLVLGLGIPIAGIFLASRTENAVLAFIGLTMVCLPEGYVMGPYLNHYSPDVVFNACLLTLFVTGVMGGAGIVFPSVFSNIGGALFTALCSLLVIRILQLFVPALAHLTLIDWLAAGLFSLYIGYDMWRASQIPHTVKNAIDVAIAIYLDMVNLFLSILRIFGSKD